MGIFQKKIGPVFLKEDSDAVDFVEKMGALSKQSSGEVKEKIDRQIRLAEYGIVGENNIAYELKNSGIDLFALHDIYLEFGDKSAQIDYLIVTRKQVFVLECKNLIGNIEIDNTGKFLRTYEMNGKRVKEGIYSPITQNERHLLVLKELRGDSKGNIITKALFNKNFDNVYKSLVVLANPKTYLNDRYAKKEIKQKVIRADQLIETIKKYDYESNDASWSEDDMRNLAEFFLSKSIPAKSDYAKRYEEMVLEQKSATTNETKDDGIFICPKCGGKLVLREAKTGANVGNKFYGCSNYPRCKYIKNLQ